MGDVSRNLRTHEACHGVAVSAMAQYLHMNEPFGEALPCRRKLGEHGSFHGLIFNRAVIQHPVNLPPSGFSRRLG